MAMNTTKTIGLASTVLAKRVEETESNMKKLCAEAGCPDAKMVKTKIPNIPGNKDDVIFVGLNGAKFYFKRGTMVNIPEPVLSILEQTGVL